MKYCTNYSCGMLIPESHESNECPFCKKTKYDWQKEYIVDLPQEALDIDMKCKTCESEKELSYIEITHYGTFTIGNEFQCKNCKDKIRAEIEREEAMNFICIDSDQDEIELFNDRSAMEKHIQSYVSDCDFENVESLFEDVIILKVELMDDFPKAADYTKRNIFYYEGDFYTVEEIIQPTSEFDGDININW